MHIMIHVKTIHGYIIKADDIDGQQNGGSPHCSEMRNRWRQKNGF